MWYFGPASPPPLPQRWFGTARMPRVLARGIRRRAARAARPACREEPLRRQSRPPAGQCDTEGIGSTRVAATVKATAPRVVIPCDDMAFRLLDSLVAQSPPDDMASALQLQLGALIRESLGDPQHYVDEH